MSADNHPLLLQQTNYSGTDQNVLFMVNVRTFLMNRGTKSDLSYSTTSFDQKISNRKQTKSESNFYGLIELSKQINVLEVE